jgi:hypothetical protein
MNPFTHENKYLFTRVSEARRGGESDLEGDEGLIGRVMDEHPEFDPFWSMGELAAQPQEVGDTVVNPFVHTALHVVVEKQLESLVPMEAATALHRLMQEGGARHESIHRILEVYAECYFYTFRRGLLFEETVYSDLLKQLKAQAE